MAESRGLSALGIAATQTSLGCVGDVTSKPMEQLMMQDVCEAGVVFANVNMRVHVFTPGFPSAANLRGM